MLDWLFEIELLVCIKMDLTLNNLQWFICHKNEPNQIKTLMDISRQTLCLDICIYDM